MEVLQPPGLWTFSGDGKEWKLLGQEQDGSLLVSWLIESFDEDGVLKLQSYIGLFHQKDDVLKVFNWKQRFLIELITLLIHIITWSWSKVFAFRVCFIVLTSRAWLSHFFKLYPSCQWTRWLPFLLYLPKHS